MNIRTAKAAMMLSLAAILTVWFATESTINILALGHYFGWW